MNQEKVGKFISTCRKNKKLTQEQLAEKLNISDRAVSKWERGLNLPDASLMIKLCEILDISVNELLTGEKLKNENYIKNAEEKLIYLKEREEKANKKLFNYEYLIGFTYSITFIILIFIASYLKMSNISRILLISLAIVLFIIGLFAAMKIEREIGFYECENCHHKYIPTNFQMWFSMHINRTRFLKCPKCNKKSWNKKVLSKYN